MISTNHVASTFRAEVAHARTFGGVLPPYLRRYGADMANALIFPPATFVEHATRLRTRKLEQVAVQVEQELRIRLVPLEELPKSAKRDLSTVLKHFRGRLR
jgi:hypothetical protein